MTPQRIQRRRTKGWCMPEGAIYVGRPTKWGNPYPVMRNSGELFSRADSVELFRKTLIFGDAFWCYGEGAKCMGDPCPDTHHMGTNKLTLADILELKGRDLVCWCPLEDANGNRIPCHADILLALANNEARWRDAH